MKKDLICSLLLSVIIGTNTWGQSNALRQSFNELNTFLKEYKINSDLASFYAETKNMKASFDYPYLTISFTDVPAEDYSLSSVAKGDQRIRTNLKETTISVKNTSWTRTPSYTLVFYNPNGIETTVQGRKDLVESYSFHGSQLTLKKAEELFNEVKDRILSEGFTGKLGTSGSGGSSNNNTGNTTSNWRSYNGGVYTIKYPANWEASSRENQLILIQKRTNDYEFMPNINIIVSRQKRTESTSDLATIAYNQVKNTGITTGSVSIESATLAGLSGHTWSTAVTMQGFKLFEKQYIVKKADNTTYIVSIMVDQSKKPSQLNLANTILGTLSIK